MESSVGIQVLLIEDNPGDAKLVMEALKTRGSEFQVYHVNSLQQAATRLTRESFGAILVDLSLPDAHHLEAVKHLVDLSQDAPILVLSGNDNEGLALAAVQDGAQDYLVKGQVTGEILSRSIRYARERKRQQDGLAHLARVDSLTGLSNRMQFDESLPKALHRMHRTGGTCALLYLDLNGFKPINDTLGHQAGDDILRTVASRLSAGLRRGDMVCRIGGDEFAIIVEGVAGAQGAIAAANKVSEIVSMPFQLADTPTTISASIGVALYPQDADCADALIQLADEAMYAAKRDGQQFARAIALERDGAVSKPNKSRAAG